MANQRPLFRPSLVTATVVLATILFLAPLVPLASTTRNYEEFKVKVGQLRAKLFEEHQSEMGLPSDKLLPEGGFAKRIELLHTLSTASREPHQGAQPSSEFSRFLDPKHLLGLVKHDMELPPVLVRRTTLGEYQSLHPGTTGTTTKLKLESEDIVFDFTLMDSRSLALVCRVEGNECVLDTVDANFGPHSGTQIMHAVEVLMYTLLAEGAAVHLTDASDVGCRSFSGSCQFPIRLMWPMKGAEKTWYQGFEYEYGQTYAEAKSSLQRCVRSSNHWALFKLEVVPPTSQQSGDDSALVKEFLEKFAAELLEIIQETNNYRTEEFRPLGVLTDPKIDIEKNIQAIQEIYKAHGADLPKLIDVMLKKSAEEERGCRKVVAEKAKSEQVPTANVLGGCSSYCDLLHILYSKVWSKLPECKAQISTILEISSMTKIYRLP